MAAKHVEAGEETPLLAKGRPWLEEFEKEPVGGWPGHPNLRNDVMLDFRLSFFACILASAFWVPETKPYVDQGFAKYIPLPVLMIIFTMHPMFGSIVGATAAVEGTFCAVPDIFVLRGFGLHARRALNESLAAANAYSLDQMGRGAAPVLLYGMGGGTFDVPLLAIKDGIFGGRAVAGAPLSGGEDFDSRIVDSCPKDFKRQCRDQGNRTTPYVAFPNTDRSIDIAPTQVARSLENTLFDATRLLRRRFADLLVQADIKPWPFKCSSGEGDKPMIEVPVAGANSQHKPEEISAMLAVKMKETTEPSMGVTVQDTIVPVLAQAAHP